MCRVHATLTELDVSGSVLRFVPSPFPVTIACCTDSSPRMHLRQTIVLAVTHFLLVVGGVASPDSVMLPQERYEIRMAFGPVVLGAELRARQDLLLRPGADDREPFVIVQYPDPPFAVDVLPGQRGDTIYTDRRQVAVAARFAPTRAGEWRDSIVLVRFTPFDRIVVRLYGVGASSSRSLSLDYGDVLTGDTVRRVIPVPREIAELPRTKWRVEGPQAPFVALTAERPIRIGTSDTTGFVVAFAPTTNGRNAQVMRAIRLRDDGVLLDTIECTLKGTGLRMPSPVAVSPSDVEAGGTVLVTTTVELPVLPRRTYEYLLSAAGSGPIQGTITDPVGTSFSDRIALSFTCTPADTGLYRRSFVLRRLRGGATVDSSVVVVSGRATKPAGRPLTVRLGLADTLQQVRIGDTVRIPVVLDLESPAALPALRLSFIRCTVRYNPSVLVPVRTQAAAVVARRVLDDQQEVDIERRVNPFGEFAMSDTVMTLPFVAVLGDDDRSAVALTAATVGVVEATADDKVDTLVLTEDHLRNSTTMVVLANAWQNAAGQRRANTLQGQLDVVVEPNPVADVATMRLLNVPSNAGHLAVVDAMGRVVADLTTALRGGQTSFTIGRSQQSAVLLEPGTYYVRLAVHDVDGNTLHSVVRLIVMQ